MAVYDYGSGRTYSTPQAAFDACQEANETGSNGIVTFTGSGLDDASAGGTPSAGAPERDYRVEIDAAGAPDTFKWSADGGSTWEASGVAITGSAQTLAEGVTVTFAATTGHTLGDRWDWSTTYTVNDFAATNYVRGYGDQEAPPAALSEPPLRLAHSVSARGVSPTARYRLVIDRDGSDAVAFRDGHDVGALVGGASDGTSLASHVTIDGITLRSRGTLGAGLIVCPDRTGGETASDWVLSETRIETDGYAAIIGSLSGLTLRACVLPGPSADAGLYADGSSGTYGAFSGPLTLANIVVSSGGPCVDLDCEDISLAFYHSALRSQSDDVIELSDDGSAAWMTWSAISSIFSSEAAAGRVLVTDFAGFAAAHSNGNCYNAAGGLAALAASETLADLSAWRERFGSDQNSSEEDPDFIDSELTLDSASPCLLTGSAATNAGLEGNERAVSIDKGPRQVSLAANWDVQYRGGKIVARIEGAVGARGL